MLVIDSFKALRAFCSDEAQFRRFLHELASELSALAVSSFWVGEYEREKRPRRRSSPSLMPPGAFAEAAQRS